MAVVLFDSQEFRVLMEEAVHISIAGPFLLYFVGIGDLMMNAVWTDWGFWVAWVVLTGYTVISLFYEAIMVPKVTRWIKNTPIKVYPAPDKK